VIFIGGYLNISGNDNLIYLTGLENLIHIEDDFIMGIKNLGQIEGNPSLKNLIGLENLSSIGEDFRIVDHDSLISFTGLENLTSIGGNLHIGLYGPPMGAYGNPSLLSLDGLNNIESIDGEIKIMYNPLLTSLEGIGNIDANSINNLYINNNDTLSSCDVQSICDYLVSPNGIVEIYDNATGCNSPEEIESDCENNCLPEGIVLSTQAEIDNFQNNYPDCAEIEGDVEISGDDIVNLNGLNSISTIGGSLVIYSNLSLVDLTGLENLISVFGSLHIGLPNPGGAWGNISLTSLSGLNNLTFIAGDLWIVGHSLLTNFNGLESLASIGGDLNIGHFGPPNGPYGNPLVINCAGLESLSSIGGDLSILGNNSLSSLDGLGNIASGSVENLTIFGNYNLNSCDVQSICDYLIAPAGGVNISDNAPGCNSSEEIKEDCENNCLPEGITFTTQQEIDNFQSNYPNCVEIEGDVEISGDNIVNLNGLIEITSIGGGLIITQNHSLTSLAGFENLTTIEGSLTIGSHAYPVWIDNPLLNSLTGLEHLTYIGGNLAILCAPILGNLTGLDSLVSIGGNFSLGGNASLTSLSGLDNLTTINGSLIIGLLAYEYWISNPSLTSLMGLANLGFIGGEIQIGGNESLSICEAEGICQYLINPSGNIDIWDNAPGCNSQQEVQDACNGVSITEINFAKKFFISPNPCSASANLQFVISEQGLVNCELFDVSGVKMKSLVSEIKNPGTHKREIDLSDIPAGVYFCVLKTRDGIQTKKIVKL